jgi:tetratricopeptide (TPR) repeat protein
LQDEVTGSVVGAITPTLEKAEIERARQRPTASLDAYGFYLRGISVGYQLTIEANNEALGLFNKAVQLDPHFAAAYARAAQLYVYRKANRWMDDRSREIAEVRRLAQCALEHGRDDAQALSLSGYALAYVTGDLSAGAASVDRALSLNTNLAAAWGASGWMKACLGDPVTAIDHLNRAMRLSPLDPRQFVWQFGAALAHFVGGNYASAILSAERALQDQPHSGAALRILAGSSALGGRSQVARRAMLRLLQVDPALRMSNLTDTHAPLRPQDLARLEDGLRKAGLPE